MAVQRGCFSYIESRVVRNSNSEETVMPRQRSTHEPKSVRGFRKFIVSAFVVFTFIAYALHEHAVGADQVNNVSMPTPKAASQQISPTPPRVPTGGQPVLARPQTQPTRAPTQSVLPTPTSPPPPTAPSSSPYKDGTYVGAQIDAFYGIVQIQAVIQNGKIADVQFLQYPNDRRTSVRINSIATPYLQQEAIQAQSANVDIISGATLTSEAFIQSLESALLNARNGS
jgi:uncharacterized protein with FMN-binding domain